MVESQCGVLRRTMTWRADPARGPELYQACCQRSRVRCCTLLLARRSALALRGAAARLAMLSRTLPRLVAAAGFALLCYAAFDTIHRASLAALLSSGAVLKA